ncbi:hypothetical protein [Leifsonia sp. NPDC077715]|uniref:hypothetical protein n=1 Tax=Leifsonia sp. NPDC077715 TaxID=3155539 RepID=UPI00341F83FA
MVEQHVGAAVHAFLGPTWVVLLSARATRAGRREFRRRLSGPVELRAGCDATGAERMSEGDVLALLRARGAPEQCVLVKDGLLEDEVTDLPSALHRVLQSPEGALISCIAGRLCFVQSDGGRTRAVFAATTADPDREDGMDHVEDSR